jgi:O-antigen ligase
MKILKSTFLSKLVTTSFFIVILGQLFFDAASHYLNILHPSWFFWFVLYGVLIIRIIKSPSIRVHYLDMLFFLSVGYLILSFIFLGESNNVEFTVRLILVIIGPYLIGRMYGAHYSPLNFKILYGIAVICILIIGLEISFDPSLIMDTDRFVLYKLADEFGARSGGSPTQFYIGYVFGATLLISGTSLIVAKKTNKLIWNGSKVWNMSVSIISLFIIFFVGSRGALISALLTISIIFISLSRNLIVKIPIRLIIFIVFVVGVYVILPDDRKYWLNELLLLPDKISQVDGCITSGDSLLVRLTLLGEAWRLFVESPLLGIGATNFGLSYCGEQHEFASPHSLIPQIIVEFGVIGVLVWFTMILSMVYASFKKIKVGDIRHQTIAVGIFSIWIFIFMMAQYSNTMYYNYHFYILTGLLVSMINTPVKIDRRY